MSETTEQIKQPQQYEDGVIYSLDDFLNVKQVHFDILTQKLINDGYVKRYGLVINYDERYIETSPTMSNADLNRYDFHLKIKKMVGMKLARLVKFDDIKAIEYVDSDNVSDKKYLTVDFKISTLDEDREDGFVMCDYLHQTCIFSIMSNNVLRFTFREIQNSPIEYQSIPQ